MFKPTLEQFVRGTPDAVLLVEFGEDDQEENLRRLKKLHELMGDLGFGFDKSGAKWGGVVDVLDPALQTAITDVRTSGLNIMMSMKEEGKPVSFVEDCAVPLEHLAEYTSRLTDVFAKHGTRGTWYAHASVGCLHVRPVLNLRLEKDVHAMRAIAEEAFAMVRDYKGSHSGEHGDGIVRSEFHEFMFGSRLVRAFEEVKARFDPEGLFNPGKIVHAPRFDDRENFRFGPDYRGEEIETRLDWSAWPGAGGGFQGAVEMCNNNGACRKMEGGVMCPSYRVTRDEKDVTRGRANTLRLAVTGQLGPDALTSRRDGGDDEALRLLQGVPARMPDRRRHGAHEDRGAGRAREEIWIVVARPAGRLSAALCAVRGAHSLAAQCARTRCRARRNCWNRSPAFPPGASCRNGAAISFDDREAGPAGGPEVVLFADTFNRYFERENLEAAVAVLTAAGYRVLAAKAPGESAAPALLRPHFPLGRRRHQGAGGNAAHARCALALYRARRAGGGAGAELHPRLPRRSPGPDRKRCRQDTGRTRHDLRGVPDARARGRAPAPAAEIRRTAARWCTAIAIRNPSTCSRRCRKSCSSFPDSTSKRSNRVAAAWPAASATAPTPSMCRSRWANSRCLPAVRKAGAGDIIVADGTSCRHQIHDGTGREALHVSRVLAAHL